MHLTENRQLGNKACDLLGQADTKCFVVVIVVAAADDVS
jgi:hypothetical protein